jgi:hypothetical protein
LLFFRTFPNWSLSELDNIAGNSTGCEKGVQPGYGFNIASPRSGVYYFSQGWKLVSLPGIRFVILPLLVNIILMGGAFWWLFTKLESWIPR